MHVTTFLGQVVIVKKKACFLIYFYWFLTIFQAHGLDGAESFRDEYQNHNHDGNL
jgi:hypothetical protein